MTHIIGGMFGFEATGESNNVTPPFLRERNIFTVNARSGIWLLAQLLAPHQVWVPSYLCHTILRALDGSVAGIRFYGVDYNLAIPSLEWLDRVQPGDMVVLIDYFGFACDASCALRAKERGAWVLEDASQALLSAGAGHLSDFAVFSPRKFLGVPDGGILTFNREINCRNIDLQSPPAEWWLKAFSASILRRDFDIYGGSRRWFEIFQKTEPAAPVGGYAMSEVARTLLMNSFDYQAIARRRVDNYHVLAGLLDEVALFPNLPSGVVPLGFPIRVEERDRLRQALFQHEIFPPVHWAIQDVVPGEYTDSHRLSAEIMTLPCDQRYDSDDMERMSSLIRRELRC